MADTLDPKMIDKRVAQRYVKKGLLSEKDYERHIKSLPDLAEQAAVIEANLEPIHIEGSGTGSKKDHDE